MALQEDTEGFTEIALGPQAQHDPNKPAHGLYVEFYMQAAPDPAETLKQGRPIHKEIAYVMIMVPGDKGAIVRRPVRTGHDPKHDNNRFHNEYVAFLQNKDAPVEGMLLDQWDELNTAQVMDLQHLGIKTVEHLANLNDTAVQKFMGLADLKNKAKAHLEVTGRGASIGQMQAELAKRDNDLATMAETLKAMQEEMAELRKGK